ncbi:MAG TPA: glycosyltransferase family 2 protein [Acidimicrobiia bacterium]|nr:glycosyltransferase family 2 protein [Acidimicrobiia bacterium]
MPDPPKRVPGGRPDDHRSTQTLSVVLPVYNEEATIAEVIDRVLDVDLPGGMGLELIIVESNSTDETRQRVLEYTDEPRVTIVLQDGPKGKGYAVREGLRHVTGDVILIQDGDLEYRIEEYPLLIAPILSGRADFVLGSRHVPGQRMRALTGAKLISWTMNLAHSAFAWLFNLIYQTKLRDPFTMFKVFRVECIEGVDFVANRFDFDFELVAKIVRRGYEPLEIPVSYTARGFDHGKKVRFFRDPLTWIVALVRFRFGPLSPSPGVAGVEGSKRDASTRSPRNREPTE